MYPTEVSLSGCAGCGSCCGVSEYLFRSLFWSAVDPRLLLPKVRSTCHGISAATGKIGGLVGSFGFPILLHHPDVGLIGVMHICGMVAVSGWALTYICIPDSFKNIRNTVAHLDSHIDSEGLEMANNSSAGAGCSSSSPSALASNRRMYRSG